MNQSQHFREMDFASRTLCSQLAEHFLKIHAVSGGRISLAMHPSGKHLIEDRAITEDECVSVSFFVRRLEAFKGELDARDEDLPQQLAHRCRLAAKELELMAEALDKVPGEPMTFKPKAYVVRDPDTNQVLSAKMQFCETHVCADGFQDMRNDVPRLSIEPIEDYPELMREYRELATAAGITLDDAGTADAGKVEQ